MRPQLAPRMVACQFGYVPMLTPAHREASSQSITPDKLPAPLDPAAAQADPELGTAK
jgi:hypothetical protein